MDMRDALPEVSLEGPGTDTIAIGAHGDQVVLLFEHPVRWVTLDDQTALKVGENIARCGFAVQLKEDVHGHASALLEVKRSRALTIVRHTLKSAVINKELDTETGVDTLARRVVDDTIGEMS